MLRARASWDTRIGTATRDRERFFLRTTQAMARRMPSEARIWVTTRLPLREMLCLRATKFKARARTMFREIRIGAAIGDRERVRLKARARARARLREARARARILLQILILLHLLLLLVRLREARIPAMATWQRFLSTNR